MCIYVANLEALKTWSETLLARSSSPTLSTETGEFKRTTKKRMQDVQRTRDALSTLNTLL